jgi:hypothetical protein
MVTALQLRANRANARLSTGPKSLAGKARAARNARRHGLSTPIWADPVLSADAEDLACLLVAPSANARLKQTARQAAAAQIDHDRIRRARHQMSVQEFKDPDPLPRTQRARAKHAKDVIELDELFGTGQYVPWRLRLLAQTPDAAQRYAMTVVNLAHQLAVFERYERRAWSKRKMAFERLYAEQMLSQSNA